MTHEISGPLAITMTSISRSGRPYVKVVVDNTEALAFEPATIAAVEQLVSMKVCATVRRWNDTYVISAIAGVE